MAQPYSNSQTSYGYGYGYGNGYGNNYGYSASSAAASSYDYRNQADFQSICDDILAGARNVLRHIWAYLAAKLRSQRGFSGLASRAAYQFRRNLTRQRILSFPHLIVLFWVFGYSRLRSGAATGTTGRIGYVSCLTMFPCRFSVTLICFTYLKLEYRC